MKFFGFTSKTTNQPPPPRVVPWEILVTTHCTKRGRDNDYTWSWRVNGPKRLNEMQGEFMQKHIEELCTKQAAMARLGKQTQVVVVNMP
jgi:hypothetical protein